LKFLKNTEVNIHNVFIMMEDFNIRDRDWDLSCLYHLAYIDTFTDVADSFELRLSFPVH